MIQPAPQKRNRNIDTAVSSGPNLGYATENWWGIGAFKFQVLNHTRVGEKPVVTG